ncbi:hypothetical protein A2U01_0073363, partial [Trifolium medium]|nr:hypothetical protein [Trifolium medium]
AENVGIPIGQVKEAIEVAKEVRVGEVLVPLASQKENVGYAGASDKRVGKTTGFIEQHPEKESVTDANVY